MDSYYISTYLDISSILPQTPNTAFEHILYFNKDNNLNYLRQQDINDYYNYYISFDSDTSISDVTIFSNPPINQNAYKTNISLDECKIILTDVLDTKTNELNQVSVLELNAPQFINFNCGSIDLLKQYAYVCPNTQQVFKVDLNTFSIVKILDISGEGFASVVSSDNKYLYVSLYTPGTIVKIDLDSFTVITQYTIPGIDVISSLVIDPNNQFLYGGTFDAPGKIIKINLYTFTLTTTLTLSAGRNYLATAIIDAQGKFGYFGTFTPTTGYVVKVNLSTMTVTSTISTSPYLVGSCIVPYNDFVYFSSYEVSPPGYVVKIRLSTFTVVNIIIVPTFLGTPSCITSDLFGTFAYIGTYNSPYSSYILKIDLSTFAIVSTLSVPGSVIFALNNYNTNSIYFSLEYTIFGVNLTTFTVDQYSNFLSIQTCRSSVIDSNNKYIYIGNNVSTITKIDTSTFSLVDVLNTLSLNPSYFNTYTSCAIDSTNTYVYFSGKNYPCTIVKVDVGTFSVSNSMETAGATDVKLTTTLIDPTNQYLYVSQESSVIDSTPATILKINLNTFTEVDSLPLLNMNLVNSAAMDHTGKYIYYMCKETLNAYDTIIKVDLSTFTIVDTLVLESGETSLITAIIDSNDRYLYLGSNTVQGLVIKIDLDIFIKVGIITTNESLVTAVIDPKNTFIYYATFSNPTTLIKINLYNFTILSKNILSQPSLQTVVYNSNNNYLYYGNNTGFNSSANVVKVPTLDQIVISGFSGITPGSLSNTLIDVNIDNKAQILRLSEANNLKKNYYLALYIRGSTNDKIDTNSCTIHTQVHVHSHIKN